MASLRGPFLPSAATLPRRLLHPPRLAAETPSTSSSSPAPPPPTSISTSSIPSIDRTQWCDLLSNPDPTQPQRARSASDASVLRRKGHLKEQDKLIEFMISMHRTHSSQEAMLKMEKWIREHMEDPKRSALSRLVPTIGTFWTPLRLVDAFLEYDEFFALSRRRYVPPNFAEIRHVLDIAQIHASAPNLKLITFDADGTLYEDGQHMEEDSHMIEQIIALLEANIHVAIVTAAGYPGQPERFEQRVQGLLRAFRTCQVPPEVYSRFMIMGGECNYLLRTTRDARLEFVPDAEWKSSIMMSWSEADIGCVLDAAELLLQETAKQLRVPVKLLRKERSVGVVPLAPTVYEVLEEMAITAQSQMTDAPLPFCAFNGGNDVFVDIGNKSLGLDALMNYLHLHPQQVLHVGDRFTESGNDSATRDVCSILWVANPEETGFFIRLLLQDIQKSRTRYL